MYRGTILTILGLFILTWSSQGCSIYKAANAPGPLAIEEVKVGKNRDAVISVLGMPRTSETSAMNERTDMHEFINGYPSGSKSRILIYIAGDLFTLGLAELIFWPIEMAALQGDEGRAVVRYDQHNIATNVIITNRDGSPWGSKSQKKPDDASLEGA